MGRFIIEGGHRLQGEITPQGAKNEALQVLCATLLTAQPVTIHNLPLIQDVLMLIKLLEDLGVEVEKLPGNSYRFRAA
ncbi:MAG TPA: UDP-N-acetylglucosamine 1-carboxyvinyltransferase, partial [Bacteroides sp.]|nr:UDP-N-acetylglucosamine 1-carboxyvinyltransferase [Bacteroides sp.]